MDFLQKACDFIKKEEGLRLKAYTDIGGKYTIGYGSTGPDVFAGVEWSLKQCEERVQKDVDAFCKRLAELVKVPVNENQVIALLSFVYNLGPANLKRSGLLRKLNLRDYKGAAEQFPLWCKVGMYTSKGLLARREREKKLFETPSTKEVALVL